MPKNTQTHKCAINMHHKARRSSLMLISWAHCNSLDGPAEGLSDSAFMAWCLCSCFLYFILVLPLGWYRCKWAPPHWLPAHSSTEADHNQHPHHQHHHHHHHRYPLRQIMKQWTSVIYSASSHDVTFVAWQLIKKYEKWGTSPCC